MGSQGSFMITKNNKIFRCPAFASKIVDKVGAGDSMLSIISICLKLKIPEEVSLFLGAIIASYSLSNYSSEETVNIETLKRTIRFMLK
jgi:sugar/nucleoside kinase (ribokinase family)